MLRFGLGERKNILVPIGTSTKIVTPILVRSRAIDHRAHMAWSPESTRNWACKANKSYRAQIPSERIRPDRMSEFY